jgi:imidazolonepropionase-like amidohydrolase
VLGTDRQQRNGDIGGFAVHKEMEALFAAGIPPYSIIRIASINGAKALQKGDVLGSIEVGKWADLYITSGNPLESISHTKNVHTVIKAGHIHSSSELLNSIKESIGPESASDW